MSFLNKIFSRQKILYSTVAYIVATVIVIIIIFPHGGKFIYEYKAGSPWKYENLIAKNSFPINKQPSEIKHEKDSILKNYTQYYIYDFKAKEDAINNFTVDFDIKAQEIIFSDSVKSLNKKFVQSSLNALKKEIIFLINEMYNGGIVESVYNDQINNNQNISIIKNKIVEKHSNSTLLTQKDAYYKINELFNNFRIESNIPTPEIQIEKYTKPNIIFDKKTTDNEISQQISQISPARGMVQAGEAVIYKGELITPEKFRILESYRQEFLIRGNNSFTKYGLFLGEFILFSMFIGILFLYIYFFNNEILKSNRQILFILVIMMLPITMFAFFLKYKILNIYLIPEIILPIITVTFYKPRLALVHHTITLFIISFFVENSFEYIVVQFIAGFAAISWLTELNSRSQILKTTLITFLSYIISYTAFTLIHSGQLYEIDIQVFVWFAANSVFVLMAYPLIYLFERIFGFISDVTLIELSNSNKPLLRQLAEKAPGTFQHSVQVANIAEAAVREIGGNSLLVRTGALYHDIGKLKNPAFFTENQLSGKNPHDNIDPLLSAEIILNHITYGVEIAKKYNIPKEIIDFIVTHQGTGKVSWFLNSYRQKHPDAEINDELFRYPGPKPYSKETAVLLMCDSLEAASRSLKDHSREAIDTLVENIVNYKFSEKQFDNADLTFNEITKVKAVIKEKLKNIYHTRIEYPK